MFKKHKLRLILIDKNLIDNVVLLSTKDSERYDVNLLSKRFKDNNKKVKFAVLSI